MTSTSTYRVNGSSLRPVEDFLSHLQGVQIKSDHEWEAYCAIHEADGGQHTPSLRITLTPSGTILCYCFVCKDPNIGPKICNKLGLSIRAWFPDWGRTSGSSGKKKWKKPDGQKVAEYSYQDVDNVLSFRVERYETGDEKKTFVQSRPNGKGGWIFNKKGVQDIPYKLPELIATPKDELVVIAEGEGKVEALRKWGFTATCNPGGAGKWRRNYARYFRDRRVITLPDNDPPDKDGKRKGWDHAVSVRDSLIDVAKSVTILELPGLPEKGDIVDWQADGHTKEEFLKLVEEAEQRGGDKPPEDSTATSPSKADPWTDIESRQGRTELAFGRRFERKFGARLKYCSSREKWFHWDDTRWQQDVGNVAVNRYSQQISDELFQEAAAAQDDSGWGFSKLMANPAKWSSAIKPAAANLAVSQDEFDINRWLLTCPNGTLDLQTGDLLPFNPDNLLTTKCPTRFEIDATAPTWERTLAGALPDPEVRSFVQRLMGCAIAGRAGRQEEILPVFFGTGSNGKTTFLNASSDTLGADFVWSAAKGLLIQKKHETHPTERASLLNKRIVMCAETSHGAKLDEGTVKLLTGGDQINARWMYGNEFSFNPSHIIFLITNAKPRVIGNDHGIWRRILLIDWNQRFWKPWEGETGPDELRADQDLKEKLKAEAPGILKWIVQGCLAWQAEGLNPPKSVIDATKEYRSSEDAIGEFVDEMCEISPPLSVRFSDLYAAYKQWCEAGGIYVQSGRAVGMWLQENGFKDFTSNGKCYIGIDLINL